MICIGFRWKRENGGEPLDSTLMGDEDVQDETDIEMTDPNLPTATVIHSNLTVSSPGFQIPSSQTSTLGGVLSQSQHCTLPLPLPQTTSTGLATTMQFCSVHYLGGLIGVARGCQRLSGPLNFLDRLESVYEQTNRLEGTGQNCGSVSDKGFSVSFWVLDGEKVLYLQV